MKNKKIIIITIIGILFISIGVAFIFTKNGKEEKRYDVPITKEKLAYSIESNSLEPFDLYFLQLENAKKNAIYSPLSIKYALAMLQEGTKGDSKAQINALIGDYKDFRECHVKANLLLIYRHFGDELLLARIGSHQALFKKY